MLHEIDAALRALLGQALPAGTTVLFDPPGQWRQEGPVLNAFLREVREDLDGRAGSWLDRRDAQGRVVGRVPAPRRYRLCYLVTAWASDVEDEHALLGAALAALTNQDTVPARHLGDELSGAGIPVAISVAHPHQPATPADFWSALATTPRTALDVVITAPLLGPAVTDLDRAPEAVALNVTGGLPPAAQQPPQTPTPRKRITEHK